MNFIDGPLDVLFGGELGPASEGSLLRKSGASGVPRDWFQASSLEIRPYQQPLPTRLAATTSICRIEQDKIASIDGDARYLVQSTVNKAPKPFVLVVFARKRAQWINIEELLAKHIASKKAERGARVRFEPRASSKPVAQKKSDGRLARAHRSANRNDMRGQDGNLVMSCQLADSTVGSRSIAARTPNGRS